MIKANDDLTPEHHQFFLYQMLRGLKDIHTGAPLAGLPVWLFMQLCVLRSVCTVAFQIISAVNRRLMTCYIQ